MNLRELTKQRQTHTHTHSLKVLEGREKQGKETRSMCVLACECAREGKGWDARRKKEWWCGCGVCMNLYLPFSGPPTVQGSLEIFFLFFFGGKNFGKWKWELLFCCHSHSLTHLTLPPLRLNCVFLDLFCFS